MTSIFVSPQLIGMLGECYYKAYCDRAGGWAYTSLENIHDLGFNQTNLSFKMGFHRYQIRIPKNIIPEIKTISTPNFVGPNNPAYVFDFLACKIHKFEEDFSEIQTKTITDFRWVEVKSGKGRFSENQYNTSTKVQIPITICKIFNPYSSPRYVKLRFYDNVGSEYLLNHLN